MKKQLDVNLSGWMAVLDEDGKPIALFHPDVADRQEPSEWEGCSRVLLRKQEGFNADGDSA